MKISSYPICRFLIRLNVQPPITTGVAHGATLVFSRGPMQLAEDFKDIHPTIMCSVPRILEQFYAKIQAQYARQGASAQLMADRVVAAGWRDFCPGKRFTA